MTKLAVIKIDYLYYFFPKKVPKWISNINEEKEYVNLK